MNESRYELIVRVNIILKNTCHFVYLWKLKLFISWDFWKFNFVLFAKRNCTFHAYFQFQQVVAIVFQQTSLSLFE